MSPMVLTYTPSELRDMVLLKRMRTSKPGGEGGALRVNRLVVFGELEKESTSDTYEGKNNA